VVEDTRRQLELRADQLQTEKTRHEDMAVRCGNLEKSLLAQELSTREAEEKALRLDEELKIREQQQIESDERAKSAQEDLEHIIEKLQDEKRIAQGEIEDAKQELARRQGLHEERLAKATVAEQQLKAAMEQMHNQIRSLEGRIEQVQREKEQLKLLATEKQERMRMANDELGQRIEELTQEVATTQVRLDQQKKFYDEERDLRRKRESELMQQRKTIQDAQGIIRKKEQLLAQQGKLHTDEASRWKQKEAVLTKRIEQLQHDWRSASSRLEQFQREILQFKKQGDATLGPLEEIGDPFASTTEEPLSAFVHDEPSAITVADDVLPPESLVASDPEPDTLQQIEAQLQLEMDQLQRGTPVDEPPTEGRKVVTPTAPPPKSAFKVKPWMRLGK